MRSSTIAVISSLCSWDTGLFNQRNTQESRQKVSMRQQSSNWRSQYSSSTKSPASHWRCWGAQSGSLCQSTWKSRPRATVQR